MKRFPPFVIHFYPNKFTDFPISSPMFGNLEEALNYAANHYLDCKCFRVGSWTAKNYPNRYFKLEEFDVQRSLF